MRGAWRGTLLDPWLGAGALLASLGVLALDAAVTRTSAGPYGVRFRTLLRRRNVPWRDIAGLRIVLRHDGGSRAPEVRRLGLALRDGRRTVLPWPRSRPPEERAEFDARVAQFQALHTRYGGPGPDRVPVLSHRTAGPCPGRGTGPARAAAGGGGPGRVVRAGHHRPRTGVAVGGAVPLHGARRGAPRLPVGRARRDRAG
ncbi:PH domain-containing protein [Streptomyces sp. NPDC058195]|uniref:PH domain-containing protein n=1 Tax=Streptomyces sp. NPDC058195 TaxID=3346375 RepID=UPI0036ECE099